MRRLNGVRPFFVIIATITLSLAFLACQPLNYVPVSETSESIAKTFNFYASQTTESPSKEPTLRIDADMHVAAIQAMAVDAQNRFLVTGSADKTIRVWDIVQGKLIKVLRPPTGEEFEGTIYAVAISPDGETIAAGGFTGYTWDNFNCIYLFNRISGDLIGRIGGLPNVIRSLEYSKDGIYLAVTLGNSNVYGGGSTVQIFRTFDYKYREGLYTPNYYLTNNVSRYYGAHGIDFDKNGRVVFACDDGNVYLYNNKFKKVTEYKVPGGDKPAIVRFSPDGTKIAVGFYDSAAVNVLSGDDLKLIYLPDTKDIVDQYAQLSSVAWSADGKYLYAGGRYNQNNERIIRKWEEQGRGSYKDIQVSDNSITSILSLCSGGVVYSTANPSIGIIDGNDKRVLDINPAGADYRNDHEKFRVSFNGDSIQFGYKMNTDSFARFSI